MQNLHLFTEAWAQSFSIALVHSLWQSLVVFLFLQLLTKAGRIADARLKYHLSCSALLAIIVWFGVTWWNQYELLAHTVYVMTGNSAVAHASVAHVVHTIKASSLSGLYVGIRGYVPYIIGLYMTGLAIMVFRFGLALYRVRQLRTLDVSPIGGQFADFVSFWKGRMGIGRKVVLMLSNRVVVPMVAGIVKPVILLPAATISALSVDQIEAILLHELAHIRRNDFLVNLLQVLVETILFFNPFVWLLSSSIRKEREHCCDDIVVACSDNPLSYASALTNLEEVRINNMPLALAATGKKMKLFHRIKRIVEMKNTQPARYRLPFFLVALTAFLIIATTVVRTPSFAQKSRTVVKKAGGKTKVTTITIDSTGKEKIVTERITPSNRVKEDDDVDFNFSVKKDEHGHSVAHIVVVADEEDEAHPGRKVKKKVVITAGDMSAQCKKDLNGMMQDMASIKVNGKELSIRINKDLKDVESEIENELRKAGASISITEDEIGMDERDMHKADDAIRESREAQREAMRASREAQREAMRAQRDAQRAAMSAERDAMRAERDNERAEMMRKRNAQRNAQHTMAFATNGAGVMAPAGPVEHMLDEMEQDGLIVRKIGFKVKKTGDELYINGKRQPQSVTRKYEQYMDGADMLVSGDDEHLSINISR